MNDEQLCQRFNSLSIIENVRRHSIPLYALPALICNDFGDEDVIRKQTEGTLMNISIDFSSGVMAQIVPDSIIFYLGSTVAERQNLSIQFLSSLPDTLKVDFLWSENDQTTLFVTRRQYMKNDATKTISDASFCCNTFQIGIALFDQGKIVLEKDIQDCFLHAEKVFGNNPKCTVSGFELKCLPPKIAEKFVVAK